MEVRMIEQKTLLIGFAFSLTPDGSPGKYNQTLAERIKRDIDNGTWIGSQWEIYDALVDLCQELGDPLPASLVGTSLVATPPPFVPDDIKDPNAFIDFIHSDTSPPRSTLQHHLTAIAQSVGYEDLRTIRTPKDTIKQEILSAQLNALLQDRQLYKSFVGSVDLVSLSRKGQHRDWNEKRAMPVPNKYPNGLRRFQTLRVNRLIIEAIIPESQLRRGGYLSTRGVLDQVIGEIGRSGRDLSTVRVYGHPAHSPRCRRQFLEYVWNHGWLLTPQQVVIDNMEEFWDPRTAQDWCKSREAWDEYENDPVRLK